jgi:uncharacterized protein (UPF0335 family)
MPMIGGIAGERLLRFVDRIERLEEEIKALNDDKAEVFAEAKGEGLDVPTVKKCVKLRKMDPMQRDAEESLLQLYMRALDETSLAHVHDARVHEAAE